MIDLKYAMANWRIAAGLEVAEVGANILYRSHLSRKFEKATVQPDTKSGQVRVSNGYQIDEFVPRHSNGAQSIANQWHMPNETYLNNKIGPMEVHAARQQGLQSGQRIDGWAVNWID